MLNHEIEHSADGGQYRSRVIFSARSSWQEAVGSIQLAVGSLQSVGY
jgi:hypothetical protein